MFAVMLTACGTENAENNSISVSESAETTEDAVLTYEQISAEDVKKLMDTESEYLYHNNFYLANRLPGFMTQPIPFAER